MMDKSRGRAAWLVAIIIFVAAWDLGMRSGDEQLGSAV